MLDVARRQSSSELVGVARIPSQSSSYFSATYGESVAGILPRDEELDFHLVHNVPQVFAPLERGKPTETVEIFVDRREAIVGHEDVDVLGEVANAVVKQGHSVDDGVRNPRRVESLRDLHERRVHSARLIEVPTALFHGPPRVGVEQFVVGRAGEDRPTSDIRVRFRGWDSRLDHPDRIAPSNTNRHDSAVLTCPTNVPLTPVAASSPGNRSAKRPSGRRFAMRIRRPRSCPWGETPCGCRSGRWRRTSPS